MATKTKTPTKEEQRELLQAKLERIWEQASQNRKRIDWQWFLYDLWAGGHHYARWDKATKQIITTPTSGKKPKVMVNKIAATTRAVVNYTLRNRPKAEVTPATLDREGIGDIIKYNLYLDYMHDHLNLRSIERGAVEESLTSGIAWVQILWDETANDGEGEITVNEIDKYDLYWSKARSPKEVRCYILAVSRPIEELKSDPKYKDANWELVKADNVRSSSTLKERLLRLESEDDSAGSAKDDGSILVKEFWYYGDKDLGEDPKTIYVCAMAGGQIIRAPEVTDLTRMPFFRLCTAKRKLQMVGKSWVRDLIPLNKRLNVLISSLAEYNLIMNKGFWIGDKGAGVRVINAEHGVILEKKRGFDLKQGTVQPLSAVLINELEYILQLFEDLSAVHDATMGRIPVGAKSGKALEALQVGDSNNLGEIVENTELWLEEIYEYILSLAASKYQFARDVAPVTRTGQREFVSVIGEDAQNQPEEALVIGKKNIVDVKITSYLAHTAEARREAIRELAELIPDLDPQTILETYEIGPIADIIARIKQNREERQATELAQQDVQNQLNQPQGAGAQEAIAVIRQIIQGQPVQLPQTVGPEFISYLDRFLQTPEAKELGPEVVTGLQRLRDQVVISQHQPSLSNGSGGTRQAF